MSKVVFAQDLVVAQETQMGDMSKVVFAWDLVLAQEIRFDLKINLQKSEIIPVGEVEDVDRATTDFGCKVGNLPTTYLGLPLGAPHNSCRVWDVVEERFKRKLATWKKQYLSKEGRLTLIKSALSNLPIYFMSLFVIPRKVRLRLEEIQREFLWGDLEERRKIHLVKWAVICKYKRHGGFGVKAFEGLQSCFAWKMALEISFRKREFLEESHCSRHTYKKASEQGVRTHPPMVLLAMVRERDINQLAFYQASVGASSPYERLSETMVMGCGSWLFVVIACKTRFTLIDDPDDYTWMAHADYPDVLWSGCIMKVVRMSVLCQRRLLFLG
ncbi:putative ribonuclease H protein [Vitis vinifera]|uniref:Putative ribonuclease H protein n=1 Tax=Vitis vinifera TaxID=29760 RepID=A0A438JU68_VITVI|nr:putative ribonuclease H protein [Vitis vinifera]